MVGVVNATISLFCYLTVLRWMYLVKSEPGQEFPKIQVPLAGTLVLGFCSVTMIVIGLVPHVIRWTETAAQAGL